MTAIDKAMLIVYALLVMVCAIALACAMAQGLCQIERLPDTDRDEFLRDPLRASVDFDPRETRR